jgi:hypothetical protein
VQSLIGCTSELVMGINNSLLFFSVNRDGHIPRFMGVTVSVIRLVQGWYVSIHTCDVDLIKAAAEHRRSGGDEKGYVKWRLYVSSRSFAVIEKANR